jgi:hypothetical protein
MSKKYWDNSLSDDGNITSERNKFREHSYSEKWDNREVKARLRDFLNRTLYHFVRVFAFFLNTATGMNADLSEY